MMRLGSSAGEGLALSLLFNISRWFFVECSLRIRVKLLSETTAKLSFDHVAWFEAGLRKPHECVQARRVLCAAIRTALLTEAMAWRNQGATAAVPIDHVASITLGGTTNSARRLP